MKNNEVRRLAKAMFAVGVKAGDKARQPPFVLPLLGWDKLPPHIVVAHDAMAAYVLKHFVRKSRTITVKKQKE